METFNALLSWLLLPISGAANHSIEPTVFWHARLMVFAWGVCLPLGALSARYFKVTPHQNWPKVLDNKTWWHAHRILQYGGVFAMCIGIWLIYGSSKGQSNWHLAHQWGGWAVLTAGCLQIAGGIWRGSKGGPTDAQMRGDHYDMTAWRCVFERMHKSIGWLAIFAAIPVTLLGLLIADAPRWMPLVLSIWWLSLIGVAIQLQHRGLCLDTYQAIWGTDPSMPGLQRAPIGWGIRRHLSTPWSTTHHE
jgi:hypothetical protein